MTLSVQVQESATVEEVIRLSLQAVKGNANLSARIKLLDSPTFYELR